MTMLLYFETCRRNQSVILSADFHILSELCFHTLGRG